MEKKVLEAVKACFDANESAKEFHVTSDGQCFHTENDAIAHSKSLENKDVELVNRKDVEETKAAKK